MGDGLSLGLSSKSGHGLESWPNLQRCFWRGFSSNLGGTRSSLITPFAIQPHFAKGFMMTANRKKQMDEEVEVDT